MMNVIIAKIIIIVTIIIAISIVIIITSCRYDHRHNQNNSRHHCCTQGGRSWQPFGEGKMATQVFVRQVFTIFTTNASFFLRVIANLQIQFSIICNMYHVIGHFLPKKHCF